ncbi:hypothetical protein G5C51_06005 [Streptomyces sp. A7024]|uniref:Uncharacterized protein n=1 Tax=Streptomyces coryli TaxID=1128680 RepID=A0A6G4TWN6_9ACTN|nr:hypothetical protein [Streptomyces coryli]NGN63457.1 hypothetical protein [Streptomyces coryli]
MSLHDELTAAQRCLDDLTRTIGRLQSSPGVGELEIRRVRTDTEHLRESLALLRDAAPRSAGPQPSVVRIPDQPYDRSLWSDCDDEGLGASDRHAP